MVIALLITNILLLTVIIAMAFFYCRKPKPAQTAEDKEKAERIKTINEIMNYNVDTARRANG